MRDIIEVLVIKFKIFWIIRIFFLEENVKIKDYICIKEVYF